MPSLLCGLEACLLVKPELSSLDFFACKQVFLKIFRTRNMVIARNCQFYFGFNLPSELWSNRVKYDVTYREAFSVVSLISERLLVLLFLFYSIYSVCVCVCVCMCLCVCSYYQYIWWISMSAWMLLHSELVLHCPVPAFSSPVFAGHVVCIFSAHVYALLTTDKTNEINFHWNFIFHYF